VNLSLAFTGFILFSSELYILQYQNRFSCV